MAAPQSYQTAGILMLISGILTTLVSLGLILSLIWLCIGVFWVLTLAVGVAEIAIGAMILGGGKQPSGKVVAILGIIAGFLSGNMIGVVLEIVAVIMLSNAEVTAYLTDGD